MKDTAKCYIKSNGGYIEITYTELLGRCKTDPLYADKLFIPLHGMLMEVSKKDYQEFYRDSRRQKYLEEEAVRAGEVSYHALDTDELSGEETLRDDSVNVEQTATERTICEGLLAALPEDERALMVSLYYEDKTEREVAAMLGISQPAVNKRRIKALQKIKILIK